MPSWGVGTDVAGRPAEVDWNEMGFPAFASILICALGGADTSPRSTPFRHDTVGLLKTIPTRSAPLPTLSVSSDGRWLAAATLGGPVRLLEAGTGRFERALPGPEGGVTDVEFRPDARVLAVAGVDRSVRLYEVPGWTERIVLRGHEDFVLVLAWSADGRRLASAGADGLTVLWNVERGAVEHRLERRGGRINAVAWTPDGRRVSTAGEDGSAHLWNAETGEMLWSSSLSDGALAGVAFTRDAGEVVAGSRAGRLHVLQASSGRRTRILGDGRLPIAGVLLPPEERAIVVARGGSVEFWDVAAGRRLSELRHHTAEILGMSFSAGRRWIVTSGADYQIKIWGARPGGMARVRPKGYFGISTQSGGDGVVVVGQVIPGTAAERAGVRVGDLILSVNGQPLASVEDSVGIIGAYAEGDEVEFRFRRGDAEFPLKTKLGPRTRD